MILFSEDYLAHYGIKGMKWKKKKKPDLPTDPNDPVYHEIYPDSWHDAATMTKEEKAAMRKHNKTARKMRRKYNMRKDKIRETTEKWAKIRGLNRPRRRSNDKISTVSGTFWESPMGSVKPRKQVKKRGRYRKVGSHPAARPQPVGGNNYNK